MYIIFKGIEVFLPQHGACKRPGVASELRDRDATKRPPEAERRASCLFNRWKLDAIFCQVMLQCWWSQLACTEIDWNCYFWTSFVNFDPPKSERTSINIQWFKVCSANIVLQMLKKEVPRPEFSTSPGRDCRKAANECGSWALTSWRFLAKNGKLFMFVGGIMRSIKPIENQPILNFEHFIGESST